MTSVRPRDPADPQAGQTVGLGQAVDREDLVVRTEEARRPDAAELGALINFVGQDPGAGLGGDGRRWRPWIPALRTAPVGLLGFVRTMSFVLFVTSFRISSGSGCQPSSSRRRNGLTLAPNAAEQAPHLHVVGELEQDLVAGLDKAPHEQEIGLGRPGRGQDPGRDRSRDRGPAIRSRSPGSRWSGCSRSGPGGARPSPPGPGAPRESRDGRRSPKDCIPRRFPRSIASFPS